MNFTKPSDYKCNITREQVDKEILKFTLRLHNNPNLTRQGVTEVIEMFDNFISEVLVGFIENQITTECVSIISTEEYYKIKFILNNIKLLLEPYKTEKLRFKLYEQRSIFVLPEKHKIGEETVIVVDENGYSTVDYKDACITYVPLKESLKSVFNLPGFFDETLKYVNKLTQDTYFLSNFIQGELWAKIYLPNNQNKIVFPLFLYYDDFETGNALGSSAGQQKLGGVYASLACLPPHLVAKLENIFVSTIAYSKHIKMFGNDKIFFKTIKDVNELSKDGIEIDINGIKHTIYFEGVLVLGDNLGMNCICGFSNSFNAKVYCRICKAKNLECQEMVYEKPELVRTPLSYDQDVIRKDQEETGILERCVFNTMRNYHSGRNFSADFMHDGKEGIFGYSAAKMLESLIKTKVLTLEVINHCIDTFPYGTLEKPNKPRPLYFSQSKKGGKKLKIKQSASQMLCLCRYLGLMIGHLIPPNNKYWEIYLYLRQIIGLLTKPKLSYAQVYEIKDLIEQHNETYLRLFGKLKPKMHIWLHYFRIILLNGPIVHLSSDKFERKNRELKICFEGNQNKKNVPFSVAIKHQLKLCYRNEYYSVTDSDIECGPVIKEDASAQLRTYFPKLANFKKVSTISFVKILGHTYAKGTVYVYDTSDKMPTFGIIEDIFYAGNAICILTEKLETLNFNHYYHSHCVTYSEDENPYILKDVKLLPRIPPCIKIKKKNEYLVMCRYDV